MIRVVEIFYIRYIKIMVELLLIIVVLYVVDVLLVDVLKKEVILSCNFVKE